jgi:hypothetical protein
MMMVMVMVMVVARNLEVGAVIGSVRASSGTSRIGRKRQGARVSGVMKVVCHGRGLVGRG